MKRERDKFLTESMGRCWHEWIQKYPAGGSECIHCEKYWPLFPSEWAQRSIQHDTTPDFSAWEGFGKLWEWAQKQEWFMALIGNRLGLFPTSPTNNAECAFVKAGNIDPDRFADAVYTFLKERDK